MNPFLEIRNTLTARLLSKLPNNKLFAEYYKRSIKGIDYKRQATDYRAKTIRQWTNAVMAATDPDNPRRGELMRFYQSLMIDMHLMSCIDNRTLPVQCAPFRLVDKDKNEDAQAKKLLEKPWFIELTRLIAMNTYQGTTLIEMIEINDKGELKEVVEIPQSNFIAPKGIIIKEESDENGTSYKEGIYKNYYIQIGNDYNLGLFSIMASIVLAKKLGMGSWMSFIEKFGVPAVFVITERMDDKRITELYEMLSSFRSNQFAILQGDEKVEIPKNENLGAYKSFDDLLKKCDEYISKYILGGTGLTDEKTFVGSAEIQERLLKYRQYVDKLTFKYYINEEVLPRLLKLSSVYKPLENLTFEYDETETLTLKEILEAIKDLSSHYEFDVEELIKITGLPITGIKKMMSNVPKEEAESQKKKSEPDGALKYPPLKWDYRGDTKGLIYAASWDKAIERLTLEIWEEKTKPQDLDKDLVLKYYDALNESTKSGWGKGYYTDELTRDLRENILCAAGAKSYRIINELIELKNQSPDKDKYTASAKKLINLYNETYQSVENKFAANSASSAHDYNEYLKEEDVYPCLMNRTMGDEDVRDTHAANEGVVKPLREWTQIPPYDPGCRCWLEQTTVAPTTEGLKNIDSKWANNPALSGKIFVDNNTYFTTIPQESKLPVAIATERLKEYMPYNRTIKVEENTVYINDFAHRQDLDANIKAAKLIGAKLEKDIYIRPHIEGGIVRGHKNPELGIGSTSIKGDLKTYNGKTSFYNFLQNAVKSANKQGAKYVVLDIGKGEAYEYDLKHALRGAMNERNRNIKKVIVIHKKEVFELTREKITSKNFMNPTKEKE